MAGEGFWGRLIVQSGLYRRSFLFFLMLGLLVAVGLVIARPLGALDPNLNSRDPNSLYDLEFNLAANGNLYLGNSRLPAEVFIVDELYRVRYVLDRPQDFLESLTIIIRLPRPGTEETVGHRFISDGGALQVESRLLDSETVLYRADEVSPQAQLALEVEVPRSFIERTGLNLVREAVSGWSPLVWGLPSIGLPLLTGLVLLVVTLSRSRRLATRPLKVISEPPSRLPPAMLGVLRGGRIGPRELAATLIDLARRGHLIIRQFSLDDFRFSRRQSPDKLEPFERELLDQIFGPLAERANWEEISFALAQEVFSRRVSQAFVLCYRKMSELGFFYTNPLTLHRRYQLVGITLFILGLIGFFSSLLLFSAMEQFLFFWLGMIAAALMIMVFSRGLPMRTLYGDRELIRWLGFAKFLSSIEPINFAAHAQEKYLAYLPYAIIFEVEVEWTRRFYRLPFTSPAWYIADDVATIDQFTNKIFPLFGHLAHVLALSSQPASR